MKPVDKHYDDNYDMDTICSTIRSFFECLSIINNTDCFPQNIDIENPISPLKKSWMNLMKNINMCRDGSTENLSEIGCLNMKSIYYPQHCGIMELNDCE